MHNAEREEPKRWQHT